jgi:hypothetical protein
MTLAYLEQAVCTGKDGRKPLESLGRHYGDKPSDINVLGRFHADTVIGLINSPG